MKTATCCSTLGALDEHPKVTFQCTNDDDALRVLRGRLGLRPDEAPEGAQGLRLAPRRRRRRGRAAERQRDGLPRVLRRAAHGERRGRAHVPAHARRRPPADAELRRRRDAAARARARVLWNEDYKEVDEFIDFSLTVKGSDKGTLYLKKAILFEQLKEYKKALTFIKLAKEHTYNSEFMETINEEKNRIKGKMPKKKKAKSSKSEKKSKKKNK